MFENFYAYCPFKSEKVEHPYESFEVQYPAACLPKVVFTNEDDLVNAQSFTNIHLSCQITKPFVLNGLTHIRITSDRTINHRAQIKLVNCSFVLINEVNWQYDQCYATAVGTGTQALGQYTQEWPIGAVFYGPAKTQIAMEARPLKAVNGTHPAFVAIPVGVQATVWKSRTGELPAIWILGSHDVVVNLCTIVNYPQTGVSIADGSSNVLVTDCVFSRGRADGVMINSAWRNIAITNNAVTMNGDDGISCFGECSEVWKSENQISLDGRWFDPSRVSVNCVIRGNTLFGNSCRGISYQSPFGCIELNEISDQGKQPIRLWRDDYAKTGPNPHFTIVDGVVWTPQP